MAKVCEICGKGSQKGNQISRGIGQRVSRRTIIRNKPNLFNRKMKINGTSMTVTMCSSCLKRIKFEQKAIEAEKQAETSESTEE